MGGKEEFRKEFGKTEAFPLLFETMSCELLIGVGNIASALRTELINSLRFLGTLWLMIYVLKVGFNWLRRLTARYISGRI
ncbi:MAG TPA: hypothetical protein VEP90_06030 [Methylomirabilota bacterium]|nr:hypothetical protein [Methylomirabilota bacterium]